MLGAIIGDIVGSRFEFNNTKSCDFDFFNGDCEFTDDTAMTIAVARAILSSGDDPARLGEAAVKCMREIGKKYPYCGYGGGFARWLTSVSPAPYNSYGNGAAMRISPVGDFARSEKEVKVLSKAVTEVTHDHPEGLKGAEAIAMAIFLTRNGMDKRELALQEARDYYPELGLLFPAGSKEWADMKEGFAREYKRLVKVYGWRYGAGSVTCQSSVPQALICYFASSSYEDTIRKCVSIGGDSDTIAAIAGGIAEARYGVPEEFASLVRQHFLPEDFLEVIDYFYALIAR